MADSKVKDLKKINKYARGVNRLNAFTLKYLQSIASAGLTAGALRSISTASNQKRLAPTRLDKMEARILKMLSGWSIADIECLLIHRVVPEAKRRATVPK